MDSFPTWVITLAPKTDWSPHSNVLSKVLTNQQGRQGGEIARRVLIGGWIEVQIAPAKGMAECAWHIFFGKREKCMCTITWTFTHFGSDRASSIHSLYLGHPSPPASWSVSVQSTNPFCHTDLYEVLGGPKPLTLRPTYLTGGRSDPMARESSSEISVVYSSGWLDAQVQGG